MSYWGTCEKYYSGVCALPKHRVSCSFFFVRDFNFLAEFSGKGAKIQYFVYMCIWVRHLKKYAVGWITINFCTDFGVPATSPLMPRRRWHLWFWVKTSKLLDGLPQNLVWTFMSPLGENCSNFGDALTYHPALLLGEKFSLPNTLVYDKISAKLTKFLPASAKLCF